MMAGQGWLVAWLLLIVATGTAKAQPEPTLLAPPEPTTDSAPPVQAPPVQAPSAQRPYVPTMTLAPGTIAVPAYPGAVPAVFASAADFVDYGDWRLKQLTARQRALTRLGRPEGYPAKLTGGFVMLGVGAAIAVGCGTFLALNGDSLPHSGDGELSSQAELGLVSAVIFGAGLAIGGLVWLHHLKRDNPYREEIMGLHGERRRLIQDIKRARRQAHAEQRLSFDLARLRVTF